MRVGGVVVVVVNKIKADVKTVFLCTVISALWNAVIFIVNDIYKLKRSTAGVKKEIYFKKKIKGKENNRSPSMPVPDIWTL